MKEEKILINNLEVNYKIAGLGPAILILHGWGGSSNSWIKVQRILAEKGYKVIVPDFPGFGKSKTPLKPWSVDDYKKWLISFIDSQNLNEFFIIAHSFGGRVAIKFTEDCPEKVKGLILCASAGIKPKPGIKIKIIYRLSRIGNMIFSPKPLVRFKDSAKNLFYIFLRNRDYIKANGTMKGTIKMVLEDDLLHHLSNIKTKTLIVWGEVDRMVPVKYAHIFNEKIKDSKLEILSNIGHSPHLEVPEKLSEIIIKFLRS
ncbi:alpha/beta fold hydrolase [Patescibacteria group bacterium]